MGYPFGFHVLALGSSWLQTRPKSFWRPLEDWRHRRAPERYPHREELARGGVVANGGAAVPITATLAAPSFDEDELQQVSAV